MRHQIVFRYVGIVLIFNSIFLFISALISLFYSDQSLGPLLYSALITLLFGIFPIIYVPPSKSITNNEGLVIVVSSWLLSCVVGALPYILWGGVFNFTNAWFESVSGYTTTGSTILINIEALPQGLLFWRATTHWLGGMGIIIFVLSVLPSMGAANLILYRTEMSSIAQENFHSSARSTLKIVAFVYIGLTLLESFALILSGMNVFDAVTHSFATIATGGFSPKNNSIFHYNSVAIELIIMLFMILSGIHFGILFSIVFEKGKSIYKSIAVKYYILALIVGVMITSFNTWGNPFGSYLMALRHSAFQIISVGTSTGFATADSSIWPGPSQLLIIFFALQCACAGSTSGGIKADRVIILWKTILRQLKLSIHPRAYVPIRIDNKIVQDDILLNAMLYVCVYLVIIFVATIILVATGVDILSAFSGVVAAIGNVGPGLGTVGSVSNFNHLPVLSKWVLTSTMLLGRLEIFGLIVFFQPQIWKTKKVR